MLQMFPLDVAKIDLMLHMLQWEPIYSCSCWTCLHACGCGGGVRGKPYRGRSTWSDVGRSAGVGPGAAWAHVKQTWRAVQGCGHVIVENFLYQVSIHIRW